VTAANLRNEGVSVREIDPLIAVDDTEALQALMVLDGEVAREVLKRSTHFTDSLTTLIGYSKLYLVIAIVVAGVISGSAVWLIDSVVVKPAGHVAKEISKLAEGDLQIDVENFDKSTEIGTIANAASAFRNALVNLEEARQELKETKQTAEHESLHDSLTGLANRRYLDTKLSTLKDQTVTAGEIFALHIDLDHFKQINDSFGHEAGDTVLKHVAETLRRLTRGDDFVARIGGDEFIVVCEPGTNLAGAEEVASRIVSTLSKPLDYQGDLCRFGASVGIARAASENASELVVQADIALYYAKRSGRGKVAQYKQEMRSEIIERKQLADDLIAGCQNGEIVAYYQPQFDVKTLNIVGAEALARWKHPKKGWLGPGAFMEIAREQDLLHHIDHTIFMDTALTCRLASQRGLYIPRLAVNVSSQRLSSDTLIDDLKIVDGLDATIALELLESMVLDLSDKKLLDRLDRIRRLGVEIDIDDFGSERASIVNLLAARPNHLKIDRALIAPLADSPIHQRLVEAIISIGRMLSIETVAEGVETVEQLNILRGIGCGVAQGFLLAKPMPSEKFLSFVEETTTAERLGA
ncbi:MAG: EAL domain-containing protein, partial [Pseudomonadota bacterium]